MHDGDEIIGRLQWNHFKMVVSDVLQCSDAISHGWFKLERHGAPEACIAG